MTTDRQVCEAAALEAPGQWKAGLKRVLGTRPCSCGDCSDNETVARGREPELVRFIARFDPPHVALLLRVEEAARASLKNAALVCDEDVELEAALNALAEARRGPE